MKIAVVAASGKTGALVVETARAAGHEVVAVVRDPARLAVAADRVERADATSPTELASALRGVDAVAWCVGPGRDTPPDIMAASARATVAALRAAGVRRIVVITASGPYGEGDNAITRFVAKPILWRFLGEVWRDMQATELVVRASGLDWTILRPPQLKDGPAKGRYQSNRDANVRWGFTIRRADLARAMVDALEDDTSIGSALSVAN